MNQPYGQRELLVLAPDGNLIAFGQAIGNCKGVRIDGHKATPPSNARAFPAARVSGVYSARCDELSFRLSSNGRALLRTWHDENHASHSLD